MRIDRKKYEEVRFQPVARLVAEAQPFSNDRIEHQVLVGPSPLPDRVSERRPMKRRIRRVEGMVGELRQQSGNRNFYLLDPATREEQPLVRDPDRGWVFSPVVSSDRRRIAVLWSGRPDPGVWLLAPDEGRETLVYGATPAPMLLGWSPDGQVIYGYEGRRATYRGLSANLGETMIDVRIVAVPVDGSTPKTIVSLPFEEIGSVTMTPDARRFVCPVYSSRSEVWLVENLDRAPGPDR